MTSATGRAHGFTLLELLVVLTILVLMTTAMPFAFHRLFPKQQLRVAVQDAAGELRRLRDEAVNENHVTEFSPREFKNGAVQAVVEPSAGATQDLIRFFPDGSTNGGRLVLSSHGHSGAVRVSALTGRIEVQW